MMAKNEMNISVTSSSAALGSATQGDKNTIKSEAKTSVRETGDAWMAFVQHLEETAEAAKISQAEVEELKAQVKKLYDASKEPGFIEKSGEILGLIYKAYKWAVDPVKSLFGK